MLLDVLVELRQVKKSTNEALKMWEEEKDTKRFPIKSQHTKNLIILIDKLTTDFICSSG